MGKRRETWLPPLAHSFTLLFNSASVLVSYLRGTITPSRAGTTPELLNNNNGSGKYLLSFSYMLAFC